MSKNDQSQNTSNKGTTTLATDQESFLQASYARRRRALMISVDKLIIAVGEVSNQTSLYLAMFDVIRDEE